MNYKTLYNGVKIPPIMLGTFQINDESVMLQVSDAAFKNGLFGFDTAPSYKNEEMLGKILSKVMSKYEMHREKIFITDKVDIMQMHNSNGNVEKYVMASIKKLNCEYIDLLLVHWPYQRLLQQTWKSFEKMYQKGMIRAIGLCNSSERHIEYLMNNGAEIMPMVVQTEIHPLLTAQQTLKYCQSKNIVVEAYSPLCRMNPRITKSKEIAEFARKYRKTVGQIVMRWHIERNVIPIFMSKKPTRIFENSNVFDFCLTNDEVNTISELNQNYKLFPESYACPGF